MILISDFLDPVEVPKPLPDFTGTDLEFKDAWHHDWSGSLPRPHRHFTEELTLAQTCQLVRNAEAGKNGPLSRWKANIFRVPEYWGVRAVYHWWSGWTVRVVSFAEGCTN